MATGDDRPRPGPDKRRRVRPTFRLRLTASYGLLFLIAGIGLIAITYVLVQGSLQERSGTVQVNLPLDLAPAGQPFPAVPPDLPHSVQESIDQQLHQLIDDQNTRMLRDLLTSSALALGIILLVAIALAWIFAGRMLRQLRTVTTEVKGITHENLHRRLAVTGPDDEIKELSDTFNDLLNRLETSFEAQKRFVANASHELRTPLARQRVIGQVALSDPNATAESLRSAHERVLASGVQQEQILQALLILARSQQRLQNAEPCDLGELMRAVLNTAGEPPAGVVETSSLEAAPVWGDRRLLERLAVNLLENARVHNVSSGRVEIATLRRDGRSILQIANTGAAIPAEAVSSLTEPFARLAADRTSQGSGLGLGLSIVAAVAETHGAELTLEPRPGGGLIVAVAFPAI